MDVHDPLDLRLRSVAKQLWPATDWDSATTVKGAFHHVVLPAGDDPLVRVTIGPNHRERTTREVANVRTWQTLDLPWLTPAALSSDVVTGDDWSAVVLGRLPGEPQPGLGWSPGVADSFTRVLRRLRGIDPARVPDLPRHRAWCGGEDWPAIVDDVLAPLLPVGARPAVQEAVQAAVHLERGVDARRLCHGDLGPHNLLWLDERVTGIIDLDHSCVADPAVDVAPLIGFFGSIAVEAVVPRAVLQRALTYRAVLALEIAAAASLNEEDDLRDHALANVDRRVALGTLHDPDGRRPA